VEQRKQKNASSVVGFLAPITVEPYRRSHIYFLTC